MFSLVGCSVPTRIFAGQKALNALPQSLPAHCRKVLLVTGRTSMAKAGVVEKIEQILRDQSITSVRYDRIDSNPTHHQINQGAELATQEGVDAIIGLGGGSAMDSAKAIAVATALQVDVWEVVTGKTIDVDLLPIVCIPSTAGTGSEVTRYSVISHPEKQLKEGIADTKTIPTAAIIDPWVMSFTPAELTAYTGGDALAQAVEAYLTKLAHPYSDLFALEAMRLIRQALPQAVADGKNLEARLTMGWASALAGVAIDMVDVVVGHHVSEAIGALFHTHHGATAAALLPATLRLNQDAAQQRLIRLAQLLDLEDVSAEGAIAAIEQLLQSVGVPTQLQQLGVDGSRNDQIMAILEPRMGDIQAGNPKDLDLADVKAFVDQVTEIKEVADAT